MHRLHSSIFNFNNLKLHDSRLREYLIVLLVTGLILTGAELSARIWLNPMGRAWQYWDYASAIKFEYYRKMASLGDYPTVLIVGDSTAARDISPEVMEEFLPPQNNVYNLASPANFPLAFRCTTTPLLRTGGSGPQIVVILFSPSAFFDGFPGVESSEQGILTSPLCKKSAGENLAADYFYMARLWSVFNFDLPISQTQWWKGIALPEQPLYQGFMPLDPLDQNLQVQPIYDNPLPFSDARFNVILEVAKIVQERGGKIVIVVPPFYGNYVKSQVDLYLEMLNGAALTEKLIVIDGQKTPGLEVNLYYDYVHLDRFGAVVFSEYIAKQIAPLLSTTK